MRDGLFKHVQRVAHITSQIEKGLLHRLTDQGVRKVHYAIEGMSVEHRLDF